jgi:hypothetical protein
MSSYKVPDEFAAMTVNERLVVAGLLEAYDVALADRDVDAISRILARVGLKRDHAGMHWSLSDGKVDA